MFIRRTKSESDLFFVYKNSVKRTFKKGWCEMFELKPIWYIKRFVDVLLSKHLFEL